MCAFITVQVYLGVLLFRIARFLARSSSRRAMSFARFSAISFRLLFSVEFL